MNARSRYKVLTKVTVKQAVGCVMVVLNVVVFQRVIENEKQL